jgi:hypothetical protein
MGAGALALGVSEVTLRCFFILRCSNVVCGVDSATPGRFQPCRSSHPIRTVFCSRCKSAAWDLPARIAAACADLDSACPCRWAELISFANMAGTILCSTIPVVFEWLVSLGAWPCVRVCTVYRM